MENEIVITERKGMPGIITNPKMIELIIPQCCREGWATCKHVPKRQKKVKRNVGL